MTTQKLLLVITCLFTSLTLAACSAAVPNPDRDSALLVDPADLDLDILGVNEAATEQAANLTATAQASITPTIAPTLTPTPNAAWDFFRDATGDEVVCGGGITEDEVVDIRPITFQNENGSLLKVEIGMGKAPGTAFSYSVVLFLISDGQPLRAFIYEIHNGVKKIGEIDPDTFDVIRPLSIDTGFDIFLDGNSVVFAFPEDIFPEEDFFPEGINDFFIQSFHMEEEDDSNTNCDDTDAARAIIE